MPKIFEVGYSVIVGVDQNEIRGLALPFAATNLRALVLGTHGDPLVLGLFGQFLAGHLDTAQSALQPFAQATAVGIDPQTIVAISLVQAVDFAPAMVAVDAFAPEPGAFGVQAIEEVRGISARRLPWWECFIPATIGAGLEESPLAKPVAASLCRWLGIVAPEPK